MKSRRGRLLWLLLPLALIVLAVFGLMISVRAFSSLDDRTHSFLPVILFCIVIILGSLTLTAYLLRLNQQSRRAVENEQNKLRRSEELYRIFEDFSDAVVFEANPTTDEIRFNPKFAEMFGYASDALGLKSSIARLLQRVSEADRPALESLLNAYRHKTSSGVCEFRMTTCGVSGIWHRLEYRFLMNDEGLVYRLVGKLTNIDVEKRSFQRLRSKAECDSLTGLYNHESTRSHIERILGAEGYGGDHALLMIDVDDFKRVNDDFGHAEGDCLLIKFADTIHRQFRSTDIVGRVGGDEFVAFVYGTATDELLRAKAAELNEALQYICASDSQERTVTCSIGVSLTHGRPMNFDALFREADAALYRAKEAGKGCCQIFEYGTEAAPSQIDEPETPEGAFNANIQLRALLEYMEGGVLLYEIGDRIRVVYSSPSYHKMVNACPRISQDGLPIYQFVFADDEPRLTASLRKGAETGEIVDMVYRSKDTDGTVYWRHMRAVRLPYHESANPILIAVITDVTALKEQERKLLDNEQLLKLALEQTDLRIWTYDLQKNELSGPKLDCVYRDLPESNIVNGLTHPDSAEDYRDFYRRIKSGEPFGSCVIRQCLFEAGYEWLRLSYRNLFDENGVPYQAIGVTEPLPSIETVRRRLEQEEQFFHSIRNDLLVIFRYNLTRDSMEEYWSAGSRIWGAVDRQSPHSLLNALYETALTAQDKRRIMEHLSTQQQLCAYEAGEESNTLDFRAVDDDGAIRWISCQNRYFPDPVSGDLYALGLLRSIDRRKRWELALPQNIECDAATGLYTRRVTEALIKRILRMEKRRAGTCAMFLLKIELTDSSITFNGRAHERSITEVGQRLQVTFDGRYVVGRLDGDTFLIFTPDAGSEPQIRQLHTHILEVAGSACACCNDQDAMHCRLGAAYGATDSYSYDMLFSMCESSLARADSTGDDRLETEASARFLHYSDSGEEWQIVPLGENAAELSTEGERTELACALSLLRAEQPEDALAEALPALGAYFGASRAFVLLRQYDSRCVSVISEWYLPEQEPILDGIQNRPISELPVVSRAFEELSAVLCRDSRLPGSYLCVPTMKDGEAFGFVCLENPVRDLTDLSLIETICELYMSCILRRDRRAQAAHHTDSLTGLKDYGAYKANIEEMVPDTLSSLGVVDLDVNGLNACNREFGKQYGDKLLQFIARTLSGLFAGHEIFRISGDEFLVLATDLTQKAFQSLVSETERRCEEAFSEAVCIGYAWSDKQLSVMKLLEYAKSRFQLAKQNYYRKLEHEGGREKPTQLKNLERNIRNRRFKLYLQPKIELKTGKCVGAEALVRFYDPEQDLIVTPDMFVPQLEKDNLIQVLDIHVFELAVQLLCGWREEGRPPLSVSVNFSRLTALDPATVEKLSMIQSPSGIPPHMLEIELTERIGSLERSAIIKACQPLSAMGYRLALDDFGCEYSSLSILSTLHFDTLKLDRSIVADLVSNRLGSLIVSNSVRLCLEAGTDCVAEGVETAEQAESLNILGCRYAQGYYFCKPIPAELFAEKYLPVPTPAERNG